MQDSKQLVRQFKICKQKQSNTQRSIQLVIIYDYVITNNYKSNKK